MIHYILPVVLVAALFFWAQPRTLADAFGLTSAGQRENYGTTYPEHATASSTASTSTTHHRFGNDTGIGSSGLQTEANTAEVQARIQYSPTAVAPAETAQVTAPDTGMPRFHLFSQRMVSAPTLSPVVTASPSLSSLMSPGMNIPGSSAFGPGGVFRPSGFDSITMPIWQPHQQRGTKMLNEIENPFSHL